MLDEGECEECSSLRSDRRQAEDEVHHLEGRISNLECKLEEQDIQIDQLTTNIAELSEYILDLETALAEAHLTSQDDGPTEDSGII